MCLAQCRSQEVRATSATGRSNILMTELRPGDEAPIQQLYDFKAINQCKPWYKPTQTEQCELVNKHAAEIPDEYIKKLREKDRRYHNTANGEVGPMEEALMSYDGCSGLIGGFYGEFSKDVDRLIKLAAQEGAELHPQNPRLIEN